MTKALRVTFPGLDPLDLPIEAAQAVQFKTLLEVAERDANVAELLWPQLEAAIRAELAKNPDHAAKLESLAPGALRPRLEIVES